MPAASAPMRSRLSQTASRVSAAPTCKHAGQMHSVGTTKRMCAGQLAGVHGDGLGYLDGSCRGPEFLPLCLGAALVGSIQQVIATGSRQRGTYLRVGKPRRDGGVASVPEGGGQLTSVLLDDQFDEGAAVEIHNRHAQRRCSLTSSDTDSRACRRDAPRAVGRPARGGLLNMPRWVSCSRRRAVSTAESRATGVPRSVTMISSPARARSTQLASSARNALIATSILHVYNQPTDTCT